MRPRRAPLALFFIGILLLAFAVTPMALAEEASNHQRVQVDVLAPDVLAVSFHDEINFGPVLAGQQSDAFFFWINYQNTYPEGAGWSATVVATEFEQYLWDDQQQTEVPSGVTFPYTGLSIFPGRNTDWEGQGVTFGTGLTDFSGSAEVSEPLTVMTAPGTVRGVVGPGGQGEWSDPYLVLTPPPGTPQSQFRATLTYTVTG
jgi:hypothetical protein